MAEAKKMLGEGAESLPMGEKPVKKVKKAKKAEKPEPSEEEVLRAKLKELGVKVSPLAGLKRLREQLEEAETL